MAQDLCGGTNVRDFTNIPVGVPPSDHGHRDSTVWLHELTALVGRYCQVMVDCPACGRLHVHEGTVSLAREPGAITVDGRSLPLGQVRAVLAVPPSENEGVGIPRRVVDLAFVGGLAFAALTLLRLLQS